MSAWSELPELCEIRTSHRLDRVKVMTFTANGEHLVGGSEEGVRVWRMEDRVQKMPVGDTECVAASNDGRWIAAGTSRGEVIVWSAKTYKEVFPAYRSRFHPIYDDDFFPDSSRFRPIYDVDFSPDSARLVSGSSTATIWDFVARQNLGTLDHLRESVHVAKYSPQGDRIATASRSSIRVWDSSNGQLLVVVDAKVEISRGNNNLRWCDNHLLIVTTNGEIKKIDAATGSTVSGWSVPHADHMSLPQDGKFIAYSTYGAITLRETTSSGLSRTLKHDDYITSIALSPDGQHLAIASHGKIIMKMLFQCVSDPELHIDNAALNAWKRGELVDAEALLSAAIPTSGNRDHVLASRALVRARLGKWDAALVDVEDANTGRSRQIQPSIIVSIAKCVALVGKGEKDKGFRACDSESRHFDSEDVALLRLIKAVLLFMIGKHADAISCMDHPLVPWVISASHVVQAYMYLLLGNKHMEDSDYKHAIQSFELARIKLGNPTSLPPLIVSLISGWEFDDLAITIQQRHCEALFSTNRIKEAGESVLRMVDQGINMTESVKTWPSDFKYYCRSIFEDLGNTALNAKQYGGAVLRYTSALSFDPPSPQDLLIKRSNAWMGKGAQEDALNDAKEWAKLMLTSGSWKDALAAAPGFILERFTIYRSACDHLEATGRVNDAVACFHQISIERAQEMDVKEVNWTRDFKARCRKKLEDLGDSALNTKRYDEAVSQYTGALSLDPARLQDLLVKRSWAFAGKGEWENSLNDANEVIELDPSSPSGYERKYVALLGMGCNEDAIDTLEILFSRVSQSPDPEIQERSYNYVHPERTKEAIRTSIENAIRDLPLVLINTLSGRLCDKSEQAAAFESTSAFTMLVASMTTYIDHALIDQVVGEFYRYTTFSHTWQGSEPLHEKVTKIMVYDLRASPTHEKLKMFCKIVRDDGFNWAWSDTCCIDQKNPTALQESLVSMFKWYEGSAMTIIYLYDVDRLAELGALIMSKWNSRGWTLQEYHASKVIRVYTKDWTPYLGLTIHNHKESPEIISEMEKATGVSAQALMALRPGLNNIREKLRLASTRQTTRVEDAAYSLLGIFSMTLPVTYGEGDKALGRLLSQLITSSGDTSILAWTGKPNSFNSCFPTNLVVFSQPLSSHIPPFIPEAEMATFTAGLRPSSLDLNLITRLRDQLSGLSLPFFVGQRMKLPCLAFKINHVLASRRGTERVFLAQADVLGIVDIKTDQDLSRLDSLYLVNPWIDFLLDRQPLGWTMPAEDVDDKPSVPEFLSLPGLLNVTSPVSQRRAARLIGHLGRLIPNVLLPSILMPIDKQMDILQFIARLQKPFGALLLASTRRNVPEFRRIATETLITVRVTDSSSATLRELVEGVRVLDVL